MCLGRRPVLHTFYHSYLSYADWHHTPNVRGLKPGLFIRQRSIEPYFDA
jgi:hypothetical protein